MPKGTIIEVTQVRYVADRPTTPDPGPKPADKVKVPKLTEMTLEQATNEAKQLGLTVRLKSTATPPTKATKDPAQVGKTLVETQSITTGEAVAKGTVIEVTQVRYVKAK